MTTPSGEVTISLRAGVCSGHAQCHEADPDLFPLDDDGYSTLELTVVPGEQAALARLGVAACPERAILLEEAE